MVLDYDESDKADAGDKTEGASSEVDTELIQRDASSYNTPTISEVASRTVKSIGASGPWWDVEDGRWINDPTPSTGSVEQQAAPPAPTQSQRQLPTHSTTPLPDLTKQQEISALSQSMSAESAPHSLSESFNNGDNDFTETAQHLRLAKQDASTSDSMQPYIPSSRSSSELSHDRIDAEDHSTTHGNGCSDDELSTIFSRDPPAKVEHALIPVDPLQSHNLSLIVFQQSPQALKPNVDCPRKLLLRHEP
jgi:hypothetical protein